MKPKVLISISSSKDLNLKADGYILGYQKYTSFAAGYFSFEEIKEISKNKNIYLLLNSLIDEDSLEDFKKEFNRLVKLDINFIVQDMGALAFLSSLISKERIIFEPYTLICSRSDLITYKDIFGVGVMIANNLKEQEKIELINNESAGILVFGHYPIYQSYRKLLSLYQDYKNVNYAKETPYFLREDTRNDYYPIIENEHGSFIFSHDIVDLSNHLKQLFNAEYWILEKNFVDEESFLKALDAANLVKEAEDE